MTMLISRDAFRTELYQMGCVDKYGRVLIYITDLIIALERSTVDAVPLEDYKSMERTVNKLTKAIADAEPVKHGHWVNKGFEPVRCSVCGITVDAINGIPWAIKSFNYCPHCGAKMDEVEEDG